MNLVEYKESVEQGILQCIDQQIAEAPSSEAKILLARIKKVISSGGKRFRPSLFFVTYKAYGGSSNVVNIGITLELFHQALLIHDDLIDNDNLRHGKLNITGLYKKDKNAEAGNIPYVNALLAGDLLLGLVNRIITDDPKLVPLDKLDIIRLFEYSFTEVIYGQQLDSANINGVLKLSSDKPLIKTYRLKTASYTTKLPMSLAALLANRYRNETKNIDDFAEAFGIYFQLANDYEDYFKKQDGEYLLKDFMIGKLTYPLFIAQKLAKQGDLKALKDYFSKDSLSVNEKSQVVDILVDCKAQEASLKNINHYKKISLAKLDQLDIKDQAKSELLALIDTIKV